MVALLVEPYPRSMPRKTYNASLIVLVEVIISTFTRTCRGKDNTGLRCPKGLLSYSLPIRSARSLYIRENLCSFKNQRLTTNQVWIELHIWISFNIVYCQLLALMR